MSPQNVETVQRVLAAHDRGDFEAVFAAYDSEIEWRVDRAGGPGSDFDPVYRGHEGVRAFWRQWFAAWETVSFEYEEFVDMGDSVLTVLSQHMRGRTSGIELEWTSYAQVWTLRDGKVTRVDFFPSREDAVEAIAQRE